MYKCPKIQREYYLSHNDLKIKVRVKKLKLYKGIERIKSIKDFKSKKSYLFIKYDFHGEISEYRDFIGNWYSSKLFKTKCPYDPEKLIIQKPNLEGLQETIANLSQSIARYSRSVYSASTLIVSPTLAEALRDANYL